MKIRGRVKHKNSRKKDTNYFYSYKAQSQIWLEGISEINLAYHLDFDDQILKCRSQPATFQFVDQFGEEFGYSPDFVAFDLELNDDLIIEAKTARFTLPDEDVEILQYCFRRYHNKTFVVMTEEDIGPKERLANYKMLHPYLKISPTQFLTTHTLKRLCGDALTFGDLRDALLLRGFDDSLAFSFVAHKLATFDFNELLDDNTFVEIV